MNESNETKTKTIVAILGHGTVGSGVDEILSLRDDMDVRYILDLTRDSSDPRVITDFNTICKDPDVSIVIECIGGVEPAYTYIGKALAARKHVVTSNKAVIAAKYRELLFHSNFYGASLRCTAAVGGGIPWLINLESLKKTEEIRSITKDNVAMQIDSIVYFHIFDAKLFAYGAADPIMALASLSATTLRNIVGELSLDETLTSRDTINGKLTTTLDEATDRWGIKLTTLHG